MKFKLLKVVFVVVIFKINFLLANVTDTIEKGEDVLNVVPLVDGHNDLPWNLREKLNLQLDKYGFESNLSADQFWGLKNCETCHTDLPRLKQGKVGAQFWVAYVDCHSHDTNLVESTLEQIDIILRFINKYDAYLQFADSSEGILKAFKEKKIASLIGLEGGHSIDSKLSILRLYYKLGVRYMTLTHTCNTPWADASPVDDITYKGEIRNLTEWGKRIVLEMNRLGMLVDLSHVSHEVMNIALDITKAPVIFSHSSVHAINPHHRNVQDDILFKLKKNNGIIMINFFSDFLSKDPTKADLNLVLEHINYVVDKIGVDHIGLGSDFDGIPRPAKGLEDVSKYPSIFNELYRTDPNRWTSANLKKLAGENFIRVFADVEKVRNSLQNDKPDEGLLSSSESISFSSTVIPSTGSKLSFYFHSKTFGSYLDHFIISFWNLLSIV